MPETADVVIIGGGIVGASIAYHLTAAGRVSVLIVERGSQQGLGSTGKSAGGVRAQFATPVNIQMSLYSIDVFSRFEELTGHTAGYRPHGYLFLATSDAHMEYLQANRARQIQCGLNSVEILSAEAVRNMVPQVRVDDVVGASYCPTDGFVDPYSVMVGFTARAREHGARLWLGTEVTALEMAAGKISAVVTSKGRIETGAVVNAAGAWAGTVAKLAGVDLPVVPVRRQIVNTEPFDLLPQRFPMVIDMSNGFHFRREGAGIMLLWAEPGEVQGFNTDFDESFIEEVLVRAVNRVPCLVDAQVNPRRCWAGLYEVTPDHHAILGPSPVQGFYLANGFSGHGVMHSPATGCVIAEYILNGESKTIDARPLGLTRFAEGRLLHETAVL